MVNTSNNLFYQLDLINNQNLSVNNQMSSGKAIQTGSEDALLYSQILNAQNQISAYEGIENQINLSIPFNDNSDSSVGQIKTQMESITSEVIKALNSGIDSSNKVAISKNIESMENTIFNLANEQTNGDYLFSGSSTNTQPFEKDSNGNIDYVGEVDYKKTLVDKNVYQEQGINGFDLIYYTNNEANSGSNLEFFEDERILDGNGNEWKFIDHTGDGIIDDDNLYKNGDITSTPMSVSSAGSPVTYTVNNTQNSNLESKVNYFDVLDDITNALELKDELGNSISEEDASDILSASLDKMEKAYDSINTSHSQLGSKNKSFDNYSNIVSSKITNYEIFYEETASADLTEAAVKAQSLELTYSALYSTISRVNSLSLVNYL